MVRRFGLYRLQRQAAVNTKGLSGYTKDGTRLDLGIKYELLQKECVPGKQMCCSVNDQS